MCDVPDGREREKRKEKKRRRRERSSQQVRRCLRFECESSQLSLSLKSGHFSSFLNPLLTPQNSSHTLTSVLTHSPSGTTGCNPKILALQSVSESRRETTRKTFHSFEEKTILPTFGKRGSCRREKQRSFPTHLISSLHPL